MDLTSLKKLLLEDYHDPLYEGKSLLEIFLANKDYFDDLVSAGTVPIEFVNFVREEETNIKRAAWTSSYALRNLKYEMFLICTLAES